jgi:predicted HTH domain antitoxin
MKTVTTRIPEEVEKHLRELEEETSADRSEVLRRLIRQGLDDWRKEKAVEGLRDHTLTVREAAETAGVSYVEMLSLADDEGVEIGYDDDELERDLRKL